ncbi:MAG: hypothetical protein K2I42_02600 [Anaeroplasmataceae bacterium]|nr:hypothetical protein [Anaeroplasmataceae bacterium]
MRNKIFLILEVVFLFLLCTGCSGFDISKMLFIASVGIEKTEDKLSGYFYLPLSSDIGKTENTEDKGQGEFAKTSGNTIPELFQNLQNSSSLVMNFRHVSSIVLNEELLQKEFLEELMDFIKFSLEIDFNCYIFVTKEKLDELYNFKNPNQESVLNSMLVSTSDVSSLFLVAPPIHFLEFVQRYFNQRTILLPLLDLEEIWTIESEPSKNFHAQSAVYYFQNQIKEVIKNEGSPYFSKTTKFIDYIDNTPLSFSHYKMKLEFKDILYIKVEFACDIFKTENRPTYQQIEAFVYNRINNYIKEFKEVDPLDLKFNNQAYQTNCNYDAIDIQIKIRNN